MTVMYVSERVRRVVHCQIHVQLSCIRMSMFGVAFEMYDMTASDARLSQNEYAGCT